MKNKEDIINRIIEIELSLSKDQNFYLDNKINEISNLIKNLDFKDLIEIDEEITKRLDKCD